MDLSTLNMLTHDEKLALVALLKRFVSEDGEVADEELDAIASLAAALGEEEYRQLVDEAAERLQSDEDTRAFLATITRQEARDTIYGLTFEAAASEALQDIEADILDWLAETWSIQVKVIDEEGSA